jgi:uncharacterized protein
MLTAGRDRVEQDLKAALKAKDTIVVSVLRMLISSLNYRRIEKKTPLSEEEFYGIVKTMIKQHVESIESFKTGMRMELAEKEERELAILKAYLPEQISSQELSGEVERAIVSCGAGDPKDMGRVMKFLMEKFASRVDGKVLSEMVRNRLSSQRPS